MKHIIADRFASIYSTQLPDYRVGVSSPVCFNKREGKYQAFCVTQDANGFRYMRMETKPNPALFCYIVTMRAGQSSSYYPAILS